MTEPNLNRETKSPEAAANGSRFPRRVTQVYVTALVAAAAGLLFIWQVWNPVLGSSIQNLMTYGIFTLIAILTVLWLVISSPFRGRTVALILGAVTLLATGAAAAIRDIEFDGDMGLVVHYRWEPTAAQRLAAHRSRLQAPSPVDTSATPDITAEDFPGYRGHNAEGIVVGPPLSRDWETTPPEKLWSQPCGGGYSSFAVVDSFLVTLEQRGSSEALVCYEAGSGLERWVQEYPALFEEAMGGPGPRATPTIHGADVYSYGAEGDLLCADLATGAIRWRVRVLPQNAENASWAMASSPLVVENLVIVEAGGPQGDGLVAVDRTSGETIWERPGVQKLRNGAKNRAGYSSPMLATLFDVRQVLIFDGQGLRGHVPETGEELWFHEFSNDAGVNVAQPLILEGERIFLSQSYGVGSRMIGVEHDDGRWNTSVLWENLNMKCKFTTPVFHDGFIYGLDEGILVCLDPETGERNWKRGRYGHGQILITNDQLLILTERGDLVLVDPDPEQLREVTKFPALKANKVWNPHALARGIAYVRNHELMTACDLKAR